MTAEGADHARADAMRNRAAILDAAADVLADTPGASLAEIATRAGLGRATLYRHFDNRDALRAAIREEALVRAAAALADADLTGCSVREGLHRVVSTLVPLGMRFRIMLTEGADADPDFVTTRDRTLEPLWELIGRGIATGELDPSADPGWLTSVLGGLLVTAVRATAAGVIRADQAGDLVCRALFDGFGGH